MPDNPKGFWEDADILDLNETLLRTFGRDHLSIAPIMPEEWAAAALEPLKSRAAQVLREKIKPGDQVIGVKDPRFARLLPFWRQVFHDAGLDVHYVIACRNPLSVAHSLRARNGIAIEKSWYLWFEHMLLSLTETTGFPRIVVDYDRLMDDPCGQLERLARWSDLPFDTASQSFIDYRDGFLDHSLRHTRFSQDDLSHAECKTGSGLATTHSSMQYKTGSGLATTHSSMQYASNGTLFSNRSLRCSLPSLPRYFTG